MIDPQANTPGDGTIAAASNGDRYLLTKDIAFGIGWGGSAGKKNDIIQYDGSNWNIVFDSSAIASVEYITNTTTQDSLKWTGSEWVNSYEGTYNPGFWRIYL